MKNSYATVIFHLLPLYHETLTKNSVRSKSEPGMGPLSQDLDAAPPIGTVMDQKSFTVICDSFNPGNECHKMIDGRPDTFYQSAYLSTNPLPHSITIVLKTIIIVNGIAMLPRQDGDGQGIITGLRISVSQDGENFEPVAHGTWAADTSQKFAAFEAKKALYIRLVHTSDDQKQRPYTAIAEINVFTTSLYYDPQPRLGIWGQTVIFPIVPVAVAVLYNGRILIWSSYSKNDFTMGPSDHFTLTATYDPTTERVLERKVSETNHDMFCPGISALVDGRYIVTGGNDAPRTSIYDPLTDAWIAAADMTIPRGYQASATLSDGRIFVLGGSYANLPPSRGGPGPPDKNGEIYDPATNTWTPLPGCKVKPMLTNDRHGIYRQDNHGWFFAWKGNSVFQAGPSKTMNWYTTNGTGGQQTAGFRDVTDAMAGIAVLYDAVDGKILTAGGSRDYDNQTSINNAHLITIGDPNTDPKVEEIHGGMKYQRIFHNGVVLPTGNVWIVGGQNPGVLFYDGGSNFESEIYTPKNGRFETAATNSIPRNYHSWAVLLQNATVLSGGGGLCGNCTYNHFDAQTYYPSYLFNPDGSWATRPVIISVSSTTVKAGDTLSIYVDSEIALGCLIRLGSATHTVDTDQRRIQLVLTVAGINAYVVVLPTDYGILIPGYYFLFVLNHSNVPSVGTVIKIML